VKHKNCVVAVEIDQYKDNENITAILWAGLPGKQIPYTFLTSLLTICRRAIR
jgi:hypothetical protein